MEDQIRIFQLEQEVKMLRSKVDGLLDLFKLHIKGDEEFRNKIVQTFEVFLQDDES